METLERAEFARIWEMVLSRTRQDERYWNRLHGDPRTVLVDSGLPLPVGAVVALEESPTDAGPELDRQIHRYLEGMVSGFFLFAVPARLAVQG